jgi:polyisoprenoid-binding protein YceI
MKTISVLRTTAAAAFLLALTAVVPTPSRAATSTWKIDPAHSAATFSIKHLAISTVRGGFSGVKGTVVFDDADASKSSVDVTIDVSTVDTREPARDKHLRSADFFDVEKYPTMTFKSTKVEQAGQGKLKVTGDLTMHGVTKSVVLEVEGPTAAIKDPMGNQRAAASATTKLNRQDYGVKFNHAMEGGGLMLGDEVAIQIDIEMIKANPDKSGD